MGNIIAWIKHLFAPCTTPTEPDPIEELEEVKPRSPYTVAFIVGHNFREQGATNYLGETEYKFNLRIATATQKEMLKRGHNSSVVLLRPTHLPPNNKKLMTYSEQVVDIVNQCRDFNVTHAICLHFNSAAGHAKGCECLIPITSNPTDNKMADMVTDLLNTKLGIPERHDDGVLTISSGHRGSSMLYKLSDKRINTVLVEPTFANIPDKYSRAVFENEDVYVEILADLAVACCNGTIKTYNKK